MSASPSKLSRFWQELKRRRVIHVITVYASAAFVIIELVGNLAEPLNLPPNLNTIVIIVLAVAFPLVVILSWLYDLTGEGFEKTKPIDEVDDEQKGKVPNAWKIATIVSFVVIIGLVTLNISIGTRGLLPRDIKSLAILPFNNLTGDDQLDWAAAAMHDIINRDMGKVRALRIFSKTTSIAFKEAGMTAAEIYEKYNVDVLVEPTLISYGDMVRIQLNAFLTYPEEKQLFFLEYHESKNQIMNLSSRIALNIAHELKINLSQQEETLLADSRTIDTVAIDAYLKGIAYLDEFNPESWSVAIESFEKAIEIEPDWAAPYAGLSDVAAYKKQMGFGSYSENVITIFENLNIALELDPNSVESHSRKAGTAAWTEFNWEKAEKEYLKALEVNPSHARSHSFYAHVLTILRRTGEALHHGKISVELDPENPLTLGLYVVVLVRNGQCEKALFYHEKALSIDPDHNFLTGQLEPIYRCLGEYEKAFEEWGKLAFDTWEKYGVTELLENVFHKEGWIAFLKELIRLNEEVMEFPTQILPYILSENYFLLGNYDKAMDYYEIIYENNNHDPNLPYISAKSIYDKMKGNPRYLELLKKMNLPVSEVD